MLHHIESGLKLKGAGNSQAFLTPYFHLLYICKGQEVGDQFRPLTDM